MTSSSRGDGRVCHYRHYQYRQHVRVPLTADIFCIVCIYSTVAPSLSIMNVIKR